MLISIARVMTNESVPRTEPHDDLFFEEFVQAHLTAPRFIERPWLEDRVNNLLGQSQRPFLLLTAEPGAGKSGLLAWLASRNRNWARYFIRRDQISPLGPPNTRSFLFQIGLQLAVRYPDIFVPERIQITIEQTLQNLTKGSRLIAGDIKELIASPFVTATIRIKQQIAEAEGEIAGLRVEKWIADPRLIPVSDLQFLALINPAAVMMRHNPGELIVVLIDALDELRYQPESDSLLDWLANCPDLPPNVRFVVSSRPDQELLRAFRKRQESRIQELPIDYDNADIKSHVDEDLRAYAVRMTLDPLVKTTLTEMTEDGFVNSAVQKANGNLGYLDAIGRAIDQALAEKDSISLRQTLALSRLPFSLCGLYGFFLHQIKARVGEQRVSLVDTRTREVHWISAWSEVYLPILGVLTVSAEALTLAQIQRLAGLQIPEKEALAALERLRQFLDEIDGSYRFYHHTLAEFLCDVETHQDFDMRDLYISAAEWHSRICQAFHRSLNGWGENDWQCLDAYGWRHLSRHLFAASEPTKFKDLFELYSSGFLAAKRKQASSVTDLYDDWQIILRAAQAHDFTLFIRFGFEVSSQYSEIAHLESGSVAQALVHLAIARNDEAAINRIASAAAVIPHPISRIDIQLSLVDQLLTHHPQSELISGLLNSVEGLLPSIDSVMEADERRAQYIGLLSRREDPQWKQLALEMLENTHSLPLRMRMRSLLAIAAAKLDQEEALEVVAAGIRECSGFELSEDFVPNILHLVLGAERVNPRDQFAESLAMLLKGAVALDAEAALVMIEKIFQEAQRLEDTQVQLSLYVFLTKILVAANRIDAAKRLLVIVFDAYVQESSADEALALLAAVLLISDRERLDKAIRVLLNENGRRLMYAVRMIPSLTFQAEARNSIATLLEAFANDEPGLDQPSLLPFLADLACGWAFLDRSQTARSYLERLLCDIPPNAFEPPIYPEENRVRRSSFNTIWMASCKIGDPALLTRTLDWLAKAVQQAITYQDASRLWAGAISSLTLIPESQIKEALGERLRVLLVESRNLGMYHATAFLQMGDAWRELGDREESLRLVNRSMTSAKQNWPASILAWASRILAQQEDISGACSLLATAKAGIASDHGMNTRRDALEDVSTPIRALVELGAEGTSAACEMVPELMQLASGIEDCRFSLYALCAIISASAKCGLEKSVSTIAQAAMQCLDSKEKKLGLLPVLKAIEVLDTIVQERTSVSNAAEREIEKLMTAVHSVLDNTNPTHDGERASICEDYAALLRLSRKINRADSGTRWYERSMQEAQLTTDFQFRLDACAATAEMASQLNRKLEASDWLHEAILCSQNLTELYQLNRATGCIFKAWEAINDLETRRNLLTELQSVVSHLADPYYRDQCLARMIVGIWEDSKTVRALISRLTTSSGVTYLLDSIRAANDLPSGITQDLLYEILMLCTRQSRPTFAGEALAATQAAIHHKLFPPEMLASSLRTLENIFLELSGTAA